MRRPRHSAWLRYGTALLVTAGALAIKLMLVPLATRDEPVLLFFAAVLVAAAFGGLGPGLFATLLATAFDGYFFMRPFGRWSLAGVDEFVRLGIFVGEGVFISLICARMKAARWDAEELATEAHELEGELLEISEAEQRRLGYDLHDGLGQQLTGIALMTRRLQETLATVAKPAADEAGRVCDLAKGAVEWTRDLCRSLSPHTLETAGLAQALRELAAHAEALFQVKCEYEQAGEIENVRLSASVHLYRIAQEAISNAVRHGHAKHIRLRLTGAGPVVTVEVIDDGTGIEPPAPSTNGMGLRIMRYRARMIGATIDVARRPEGGTTVTCRYQPARNRVGAANNGNA
jgi:signal transduction histidine kinase